MRANPNHHWLYNILKLRRTKKLNFMLRKLKVNQSLSIPTFQIVNLHSLMKRDIKALAMKDWPSLLPLFAFNTRHLDTAESTDRLIQLWLWNSSFTSLASFLEKGEKHSTKQVLNELEPRGNYFYCYRSLMSKLSYFYT